MAKRLAARSDRSGVSAICRHSDLNFSLFGPAVMEEAQKLTQQAPGARQQRSKYGSLVQQLGARHGWNRVITVGLTGQYLDHIRGN